MSVAPKVGTPQWMKADVICRIEDGLRLLALPNPPLGVCDDGETCASHPYKVGYVQAMLKDVLKDIRVLKVRA